MKNNKAKNGLICWIVGAVISVIGLVVSCVFNIVGLIMTAIVFIILCVLGIISSVQDLKKPLDTNSSQFVNPVLLEDKKLHDKYNSIKDNEFNDVNFVSFANEGLKFSAKGKYGCIKDFNGKKGYHLAFSIEGIEMVEKPKDYEDVVNYNELLFLIELGYFDGSLLSTPENDNGIIVKDIDNLQGKTIQIKQDEGYFAYVHTAESDEIAIGEIKFVQWNQNSKILKFKLLVNYGLCDVVVGTVELTEDKDRD